MAFDYDLFVSGGGSGGVRAARVAAGEHGAKVALAEEDRYGGTCVIRGCVPKKLMVFASGYSGVEAEAGAYGWDITLGDFNWDRFKGSMHAELDRLEAIYRRLLANSGVETFDARATVKDSHTVVLSTGEEKTAKHILVAVGGCPTRPNIPNADVGIVSDDLFDLPELPKTMLIIGGGYIASEFAGVMNGLGVSVTQYYRGEQILRGFDNEARTLIADQMLKKASIYNWARTSLRWKNVTAGFGLSRPLASKPFSIRFCSQRAVNQTRMVWVLKKLAACWAVVAKSLWMSIAKLVFHLSMRLAM